MTAMQNSNWHVSRSWSFPEVEHDCDCPRTPCGGTWLQDWFDDDWKNPKCDFHNLNKSIRNRHDESECEQFYGK